MADDLDTLIIDEPAELPEELAKELERRLPGHRLTPDDDQLPGTLIPYPDEHERKLRELLPRRTNLKQLRRQRPFNAHTRWGPAGRPKEPEPAGYPEYPVVVWYGGKGERMQVQHPARYSGPCHSPNRDGQCQFLFPALHPAMARPYTFSEKQREPDMLDKEDS